MPLLTTATISPGPGTGQPPTTSRFGWPRLTWTDSDGTSWDLTDPLSGLTVMWDVLGLGSAVKEFSSDPMPGGGVRVRNIYAGAGELAVPLDIRGETQEEFYRLRDDLRYSFRPWRRGERVPGTLTLARPSGHRRKITAFCTAFPEDSSPATNGPTFQKTVLEFLCPDPYWEDVEPEQREWTTGTSTDTFYNPYWTTATSHVLGEGIEIRNRGQVEAFPTWTITGPSSSVVFTNNTTGKSFTITHTLTTDETVTIVTRRGRQSVRLDDGTNLMSSLNWPGAQLFPLVPGINELSIQLSGAGTGSSVSVVVASRYEGA